MEASLWLGRVLLATVDEATTESAEWAQDCLESSVDDYWVWTGIGRLLVASGSVGYRAGARLSGWLESSVVNHVPSLFWIWTGISGLSRSCLLHSVWWSSSVGQDNRVSRRMA